MPHPKREKFNLSDLLVVNPNQIITKGSRNEVNEVMLNLAIIFNSLKGGIQMHRLFSKEYEAPNPGELNGHAGEYEGLFYQHIAINISLIQEFFVFLSKVKKILSSADFEVYSNRLPINTRKQWEDLLAIALDKNTSNSKFSNFLKLIRNNVGFHFNYNLQEIREGYIHQFFEETQSETNKYAFFSIGKNIEETRFYFGDAAIQGLMNMKLPPDFNKDFFECIDKISQTVSALLALFLNEKDPKKYTDIQQ